MNRTLRQIQTLKHLGYLQRELEAEQKKMDETDSAKHVDALFKRVKEKKDAEYEPFTWADSLIFLTPMFIVSVLLLVSRVMGWM